MKKWFNSLLDPKGEVSSKRVCTLLCVALLAIGFIVDVFFNVNLDPAIIDPVTNLAMFGLGAVASEKLFSKISIGTNEAKDE